MKANGSTRNAQDSIGKKTTVTNTNVATGRIMRSGISGTGAMIAAGGTRTNRMDTIKSHTMIGRSLKARTVHANATHRIAYGNMKHARASTGR